MSKNKILVYGANGYMGQLFLKLAQGKGLDLVAASRVAMTANVPVRQFSLGNKETILSNLKDIKLVINLAGPFKNTNKQWVEACIESGTHYIDIAGEYLELESVFGYDKHAQQAGVMLMPGAGFGVVPTDIVANLAKHKLPDATNLKIAYVTNGGASRGTLKTVLSDINKEGVIVKDGHYQKAMPAFQTFSFRAQNNLQQVVYNPWRADLFAAKISTGMPNIETYANFPGFVVSMMKGKLLWLRDFLLKRAINLLPVGPSEKQLNAGSTICYAEVSNAKGQKASATILGPEAYVFTAQTLLAISKQIISGNVKPGYQTPNFYGVALLNEMDNVKINSDE